MQEEKGRTSFWSALKQALGLQPSSKSSPTGTEREIIVGINQSLTSSSEESDGGCISLNIPALIAKIRKQVENETTLTVTRDGWYIFHMKLCGFGSTMINIYHTKSHVGGAHLEMDFETVPYPHRRRRIAVPRQYRKEMDKLIDDVADLKEGRKLIEDKETIEKLNRCLEK
jgi:hypothetical protein